MTFDEKLNTIRLGLVHLADELDALSKSKENEATDKVADDERDVLNTLLCFLASEKEDALQLQLLLQCVMHVVHAKGAGLTVFDKQKERLVFKAAIGDGAKGIVGYEVPLVGSQHGLAFATGDIQASAPIHTDIESAAHAGFQTVLVAPLFANGETIGTISAVNTQSGDGFTSVDIDAMRQFAALAGVLLHHQLKSDIIASYVKTGCSDGLPDELTRVAANDTNLTILTIVENLMTLSGQNPDGLVRCRELSETLTALSQRSPWTRT